MRRSNSFAWLALAWLGLGSILFAAEKKGEPERLDVPVPVGHEAKQLKLPVYDAEGKLRMSFFIQIAKRIDDGHIEMASARIETFDDEGKREILVDLPSSVLDLETSIVSSNGPVTIQRADFELTGEGMKFDTRTRQGILTGKIRMLIYDRSKIVEKKSG